MDPTPPPPLPPRDSDGDRILDSDDNCISVQNPNQNDFDGDNVGDLCDMCPATLPGVAVDGFGCDKDGNGSHTPPDPLDPDGSQSEGCACAAAGAPASWPWLFFLPLGAALRRRWRR